MRTPEAHGQFELLTDHNILVCRLSDHWTLGCAEKYVTEIQQQVNNMGNQPWCRVVNMHGFMLGTPEVIALMHEFGKWSLQHHCVEHVFLFSNPRQMEQVNAAYKGLFDIKRFYREKDALFYCSKTLRHHFINDAASRLDQWLANGA